MGLFGKRAQPAFSGRTAQVVLPSMQAAQSFAVGLAGLGRRGGLGLGSFSTLSAYSDSFGGRHVRSLGGREVSVYGHQPFVTDMDREYLWTRNPTAQMLIERPARESWFATPRAYADVADSFMRQLRRLDLARAATAADELSAAHGGGLAYLRAGGKASSPLQDGDRWRGFTPVPLSSIRADSIIWDESGSALTLQHGIESLEVMLPGGAETVEVHGSRLVSFSHDPKERHCSGVSVIDSCFNALWDFTDHMWAGRASSVEGDPVVAEVDLDHPDAIDITTEKQKTDYENNMQSMFLRWRNGHNKSLSARGIKFTRLGKADLPDRSIDIQGIATQIAHASKWFTIEQIMASPTGSRKEDQTTLEAHEGLMHVRSQSYCWPIYQHLWTLAQASGMVPKRSEMPLDLDWPRLRRMDERQQAIALRSDAMTLQAALRVGYLPPRRVLEKFTIRPEGPVPLQPSAPEQMEHEKEMREMDLEDAAEGRTQEDDA